MIKGYLLIKKEYVINRSAFRVIDSLSAMGLRKAEKDFRMRNNFKKFKRNELMIARLEKWFG